MKNIFQIEMNWKQRNSILTMQQIQTSQHLSKCCLMCWWRVGTARWRGWLPGCSWKTTSHPKTQQWSYSTNRDGWPFRKILDYISRKMLVNFLSKTTWMLRFAMMMQMMNWNEEFETWICPCKAMLAKQSVCWHEMSDFMPPLAGTR